MRAADVARDIPENEHLRSGLEGVAKEEEFVPGTGNLLRCEQTFELAPEVEILLHAGFEDSAELGSLDGSLGFPGT